MAGQVVAVKDGWVVEDLPPGEVGSDYHLGVWVAGYEQRAGWLVQSSHCPSCLAWRRIEFEEERSALHAPSNRSIGLGSLFDGRVGRRNHDGYWRQAWFRLICEARRDFDAPLRLFVDYSSLSRAVYASLIVEAMRAGPELVEEVVLGYAPGVHEADRDASQRMDGLRSVAGLEGRSTVDKDPAFVVAIGYDGALAEAVLQVYQVDRYSVFVGYPGVVEAGATRALASNAALVSGCEMLGWAPAGSVSQSLVALGRMCEWYRPARDVVLIPMGPKPQVVAAVLLALRHQELAFRTVVGSSSKVIDVAVPGGALPYCVRLFRTSPDLV